MLAEITSTEFSSALDNTIVDLFDTVGVSDPPIDALVIARRLGIAVQWDDRQASRARYVRLRGTGRGRGPRSAILLRNDPRRERRQWAIAHELGEHVAWQVFERLGVDPREAAGDARERVANLLAGRILLPSDRFFDHARQTGWDLLALKATFSTASHELIARRMLDAPEPTIVSIFDQGSAQFRRSNLPGQTPPLCSSEYECWQHAHGTGTPTSSAGDVGLVQAWPVHEPGWRREIVRREIDELAINAG